MAPPVTSEGTTVEGIVTEHLLLLLLPPWELTHPATATATAKCSGHGLNLPEAHHHFPGPCNYTCATFLQVLATIKSTATKHSLLVLPIASFSLETHSALWG